MYRDIRNESLFADAHERSMTYIDEVFDRNVYPTEEALSSLRIFDEDFPDAPTEASGVIDLLGRYGAPATVAQLGGRYFGFVNGSVTPVGLAAKEMATFWDQNTAMHVLSPFASRLESVVEGWLNEIFGLPDGTVAGFVSGTSLASFSGLAAGRYRLLERLGWDINTRGLFEAPRLRVVTGDHAHATVHKAVAMLGLGADAVERVPVDSEGRLIASALPPLDDHTLLVLQAGNVNSGSFDPFADVCEAAREAGAWIHIDGAFGMWAAATERLAHLTRGIELADSWAVDGHKTLNTPYDSGIVLCRDSEALSMALHASGSYLVLGEDRNSMFFTPEMSRRSRIIELWATLKYLGRSGVDEMVNGLHERAAQFADEVGAVPGFSVLNDVVFNQVMVRCDTDELTSSTLSRIQDLRECWVGGASWNGRRIIRVSVCSWATTPDDVSRSVASFAQALDDVVGGHAIAG